MTGAADLIDPAPIPDVSALLGEGLPPGAQFHLDEAAKVYANGSVALDHLKQAEAIAPGHPAVLIGLYRFFFYKGRLEECLKVCLVCLSDAARYNNLAEDWRQVQRGDAVFNTYDDMMPRFYLFVLKGYAYLQMRLGNVDEGLEAVMKLLELDPTDKIGATLLLEVHQRMSQDDDD